MRQFGWNSNTVQCSKLPDNPKRRIFEFLEMTSSSHLSNASMCDEFIFPPPHSSLRRGRELGEFSALHSTPFSVVGCHHLQQAKHSLRSCQSVQLFYEFDERTSNLSFFTLLWIQEIYTFAFCLRLITVFENHWKSLIQHCERSELRFILSGQKKLMKSLNRTKIGEKWQKLKCDIWSNF